MALEKKRREESEADFKTLAAEAQVYQLIRGRTVYGVVDLIKPHVGINLEGPCGQDLHLHSVPYTLHPTTHTLREESEADFKTLAAEAQVTSPPYVR